MENTATRNPFAEMTERPGSRRTLEIVAPENKEENVKMKKDDIKEIKEEEIEELIIDPDCAYAECRTEGRYCDLCNKPCDGIIKANIKKSIVMDESKICVKMNAIVKDTKAKEVFVNPMVYTISPDEALKLKDGNKVAYIEINLNEVKPVNNSVRIFFGVKEENISNE